MTEVEVSGIEAMPTETLIGAEPSDAATRP